MNFKYLCDYKLEREIFNIFLYCLQIISFILNY